MPDTYALKPDTQSDRPNDQPNDRGTAQHSTGERASTKDVLLIRTNQRHAIEVGITPDARLIRRLRNPSRIIATWLRG